MKSIRIYVSSAIEDEPSRLLLRNLPLKVKPPPIFRDTPISKLDKQNWEGICKSTISGCDGAIFLISEHTDSSDSCGYEIDCVYKKGYPILVVRLENASDCKCPIELENEEIVDWDVPAFEDFINRLRQSK